MVGGVGVYKIDLSRAKNPVGQRQPVGEWQGQIGAGEQTIALAVDAGEAQTKARPAMRYGSV